MVKKNYQCSEPDLYTTCRLIWLLVVEHIAKLGAYKAKYTLDMANDNLTLIKTVELMPTYGERKVNIKSSMKSIDSEQSDAILFFKQLKGYIKEAYADNKTLCDAQITEAGQSNFDKVVRGDWREVKGLYSAMTRFVENYRTDLTDKGYLPADFGTRLTTSQSAFKAAHQTYKSDSETVPDTSEARTIANNDLKARAMSVLADAQIAFADDKRIAQKFVWNTVITEVRGVKPAGLIGGITDAHTEGGLQTAVVRIPALNKTATTDNKGRYDLSPLPIGTHDIEFSAEGYETLVIKREIKLSVMGRLNVALVPVASLVAVGG